MMGEPKDRVSPWAPWSMALSKMKMVMKMTRYLCLQVRESDSPYLARQRCHGKPRPPMGPGGPLLVLQGVSHCTKSRRECGSTAEITRVVLPRFGPPRGVKPYSWFGRLMVERWWWSIVHLPGRGCLKAVVATRVWESELSNFLSLSTVAMASFYRSKGYHNGKVVIMH